MKKEIYWSTRWGANWCIYIFVVALFEVCNAMWNFLSSISVCLGLQLCNWLLMTVSLVQLCVSLPFAVWFGNLLAAYAVGQAKQRERRGKKK